MGGVRRRLNTLPILQDQRDRLERALADVNQRIEQLEQEVERYAENARRSHNLTVKRRGTNT